MGSNTGVVYYGPGAPAIVSTTLTNNRSVELCNGQLYFSTGSGATRGIWAVGTGLPTGTGTASTNVINTGGSSSPYEFVFNAAGTTCYIADDRTVATGGGIQRWDLVGGVWTLSYTLGTGGTVGARGVEVDFSGVIPIVYGITADGTGRLVRIDDTGAGSAATTLATAPANTAFRGVALAPQDCDPPVVNVTTNSPICAGDVLNLSATATGVAPLSYAWFGPSGTFSPNGPSVTVTGASSGIFYVTVGSGCGSTTVPVNVVVNNPPTLSAVITPASCPGQSNGAIDLTVTGGTGTPTFSWTSTIPCGVAAQCPGSIGVCQGGVCAGTGLPEDLTGLPAGPYTVTVTMDGCTVTQTFTVGNLNLDTDGDLVPDCVDSCPTTPGQIGTACDDGNPNTVLDVLDGTCTCVGQACTTDLVLEFDTDANASQITWELRASGSGILVQSGGGLPGPVNSLTVNTCLPDGCYYLRVLDAGGDGIANGGYILRTLSGAQRIIDNQDNFSTGSVSAVIGNGGFCLPLGGDKLIFTSCDKLDWVNNQFIVAAENPAVSAQFGVNNANSGYQFWWFDPNGTYGYSKFRSHATSDGFGTGALRACHARINNWTPATNIPANVLMNVKVRGRVNGTNLPWGPVCRFMIDPVRAACPLTKLVDIPGNAQFSCGVTRTWGGSSLSKVVAKAVDGATQYQFRFVNGEVPGGVVRTTTTPVLQLNWTPALDNGTYEVEVRAFKNGQWCVTSLPWGDVCNVTITGSPNAMELDGGSTTSTGDVKLALFPNPNNGQQLTVSLSAVEEGVETVAVDIFDLSGARVSSRTIAVNDGMVYQVVDVAGLADGLYMVNITAGGQRYTERLVVAK